MLQREWIFAAIVRMSGAPHRHLTRAVKTMLLGAAHLFCATFAQAASLYFDGTAYGLAIDDLFGGGYQSTWTMEAWVKTASPVQDRGAILNKEGFWTEVRLFDANGQFEGFYATNTPSNHYETTQAVGTFMQNSWTHVALVSNGSTLKLFEDGTLIGEDSTVTGPAHWASDPTSDSRLKVGKMIWGGSPFYFNGWIAEVRVSSTARYSSNFVPAISYSTDANTELLLGFDEGAGSVAYDASIHGHNFNLYGTQWSADTPIIVPEPGCALLLSIGLVGLYLSQSRKCRARTMPTQPCYCPSLTSVHLRTRKRRISL